MHPQRCLGSLRAPSLARTKGLQIEALLIPLGSTHAQPSWALIQCHFLMNCWQWDIPDILYHLPAGISEPSPVVLAGPITEPQPNPLFSPEEVFSWPACSAGKISLLDGQAIHPPQETSFTVTLMDLSWKPLSADFCYQSAAGPTTEPSGASWMSSLWMSTSMHCHSVTGPAGPSWTCNWAPAKTSVP
jgi:hypothetical protein